MEKNGCKIVQIKTGSFKCHLKPYTMISFKTNVYTRAYPKVPRVINKIYTLLLLLDITVRIYAMDPTFVPLLELHKEHV
jgi:hypothetical protein